MNIKTERQQLKEYIQALSDKELMGYLVKLDRENHMSKDYGINRVLRTNIVQSEVFRRGLIPL